MTATMTPTPPLLDRFRHLSPEQAEALLPEALARLEEAELVVEALLERAGV